MSNDEAMQAVLAADDRRLAALEADDVDALAALLAPSFLYLHANGRIDDRSSLLGRIASGSVRHRGLIRHEARVVADGTTAVVSGRFSMDVQHPPVATVLHLDNRFLAAWCNEEGSWRLLALASVRNSDAGSPANPCNLPEMPPI